MKKVILLISVFFFNSCVIKNVKSVTKGSVKTQFEEITKKVKGNIRENYKLNHYVEQCFYEVVIDSNEKILEFDKIIAETNTNEAEFVPSETKNYSPQNSYYYKKNEDLELGHSYPLQKLLEGNSYLNLIHGFIRTMSFMKTMPNTTYHSPVCPKISIKLKKENNNYIVTDTIKDGVSIFRLKKINFSEYRNSKSSDSNKLNDWGNFTQKTISIYDIDKSNYSLMEYKKIILFSNKKENFTIYYKGCYDKTSDGKNYLKNSLAYMPRFATNYGCGFNDKGLYTLSYLESSPNKKEYKRKLIKVPVKPFNLFLTKTDSIKLEDYNKFIDIKHSCKRDINFMKLEIKKQIE